MKWQVFDKQENTKDYFDPDSKSIFMKNCELGNHPTTAQKIYDGENKTVCAWVSCDDYQVWDNDRFTLSTNAMTHYKYNPKKNPHWFTDNHDNRDGLKLDTMITQKRAVYG
tara:strand:+ start:116 stop:448 length:333 start_codon:yes stop_codon:yes gene_type:complete